MFIHLLRALRAHVTLSAVPAAGGAQDCSGTITVEEALRAEEARYAAQMAADIPALKRTFGEDLVYIHSSTVQDTKASFIESIASGAVKYRKITRGEVTVRTYGCLAIVSGRGKFEVTARGQDMTLELLFHAIWAKRTGGAQFVSWQATRLPAQ